jgi:hypothetical protein
MPCSRTPQIIGESPQLPGRIWASDNKLIRRGAGLVRGRLLFQSYKAWGKAGRSIRKLGRTRRIPSLPNIPSLASFDRQDAWHAVRK